jgi:hypothetical protein
VNDIQVFWSEEDGAYVARSPRYPSLSVVEMNAAHARSELIELIEAIRAEMAGDLP